MGDSVSMYPNDLGMKAFAAVGAPCLETLSCVDKVRRAVTSCPTRRLVIVGVGISCYHVWNTAVWCGVALCYLDARSLVS